MPRACQFSFAFAALFAVCILCVGLAAESRPARPERGSVSFGSSERPEIGVLPHMEAFSSVFAEIAGEIIPAVVSVVPVKIDTVIFSNNPFYQFFGDPFSNPFDQFFDHPKSRKPAPLEKRQYRQQGLGSGVIVSRDGYVLTNFHVVAGADEITIKTSDGRVFESIVIGADSLSDVAVVKILGPPANLPVIYLGDSEKIRSGDWVIAVGNPFSLTSSVTMGIVSALGRTTPGNDGSSYQNFIQTDAAINPGNSGGALVNIRGELIGINTLIYTQSGGNMGIGFAIPINMARRIMEDLIYEGQVSRGWLGVTIQDLDEPSREAMKLRPEIKGVLVGDVLHGQPAEKAGLRRGDVITRVEGHSIESTNQLKNVIAGIYPGQKVPVEVLRGNRMLTLYVKLTGRENEGTRSAGSRADNKPALRESGDIAEKIGMAVGTLTPDVCHQLRISPQTKGVVVLEILPSSQASQEGFVAYDVILEVNRNKIVSLNAFKNVLDDLGSGSSILFLVQRKGSTFYKAFRIRS